MSVAKTLPDLIFLFNRFAQTAGPGKRNRWIHESTGRWVDKSIGGLLDGLVGRWVDGLVGRWLGCFAEALGERKRKQALKNRQGRTKTGVLDVLGLSVAPRGVTWGAQGDQFGGLGASGGSPGGSLGVPGRSLGSSGGVPGGPRWGPWGGLGWFWGPLRRTAVKKVARVNVPQRFGTKMVPKEIPKGAILEVKIGPKSL